MPKIRHRKRVRTARLTSTGNPLGNSEETTTINENGASTSTSNGNGNGLMAPPPVPVGGIGGKKVGKKDSEVTNLLEKLASDKVEDRVWASSALSSLLLTLPEVTLRLLLSKNLIGLLIERLSDEDDEVVVECLGSLRNLAVSSPPSILSEMHNKKLLTPLATTHLPLLLSLLPSLLLPAPAPLKAPLPSTPTQRLAVEFQNNRNEKRRRLYWDWSENVLYLIWCLAESTTRILGSLNNVGEGLIGFLVSYLESEALRIESIEMGLEDGMDVEGGNGSEKKGKKSKKGKTVEKKERVPLFCAVAAAQTLHAYLSSNPTALSLLISHPTALNSLSSILQNSIVPPHPTRTDNHHSDATSDSEDYTTLRVVAFGILLEVSNSSHSKEVKEEVRAVLSGNEGILMEMLGSDLEGVATASLEAIKGMNPVATPGDPLTGGALTLALYEKKLSTLQLSLEILGQWCASLDAETLADSGRAESEEEEWGGIPTENDVDMDEDDEEDEDEEVILGAGAKLGEEGGEMDDDAIDIGDESSQEGGEEEELPSSAFTLFLELPSLLMKLAQPTSLSFPPPSTTSTTTTSNSTAPNLIPTASTPSTTSTSEPISPHLSSISEHITTIHVRSLECLNNLYITLSRSIASSESNSKRLLSDKKLISDLQSTWETVLGLVQIRLTSQGSTVPIVSKKDEEVGEDRSMELVMAGVGAVWGMSRIGLGPGGSLIVGEATTPFLIEIFKHPYATAPTPSGESIQVRIVGSLGYIGRRTNVTAVENESIGTFLLSLLPFGKIASSLSPTPEVLLQAIDSLIDLYSDEESSYDVEVFRNKGFLGRLDSAVVGVRAAAKKIDRKKFPELRSRADGALDNLAAFVEYRKGI